MTRRRKMNYVPGVGYMKLSRIENSPQSTAEIIENTPMDLDDKAKHYIKNRINSMKPYSSVNIQRTKNQQDKKDEKEKKKKKEMKKAKRNKVKIGEGLKILT